ncbi:uncharacterized protein LOC111678198 [Lucilia cuprina]|uniref:uncharacterized protein LOC111678198 n=1 Tax=Lucilia cuprina TaxID=7375 RepID=UPI001F06F588|nr:uncharacterized protein LOC111678198 [Lucilia cuprina]
MAMKKENIQKLNYRIKVLAGNNVVLVECDHYESEIFMPQIVNGRITFLNIIPNRRCCQVTKTNVMNFASKEMKAANTYLKEQNVVNNKKLNRFSAGDAEFTPMIAPLANSTPANVKKRSSCGSLAEQHSPYPNSCGNSIDASLPTPEVCRRAAPAPTRLLERSMLNLPPGVKVARIYHNSVEGTPKKVGRLVTPSKHTSVRQNSANVSILNGSFRLPCSPAPSNYSSYSKSTARTVSSSTALDSIAKWQKVLTPVRTYTRKSKNPVMIKRPVTVESAKKSLKPLRITPTYLVNPTQGPNVTQEIEIKKRKLIVDSKISISPKTFKKQQTEPLETYKPNSTNILQTNSLGIHKPRPLRETMALSAFDLLTNSNHQRCMSAKLNEQFRRGCVNKASSTYSKYKVLSTVPSLQQDEQVLELTRISLSSTESRQLKM